MPETFANKKFLMKNSIKRRDVLKTLSFIGVASLGTAGPLTKLTNAQHPQMGGTLRQAIGESSNTNTLNPASIQSPHMINLSYGQLRNCLTEIGSNGKLEGELAESWEASPDAKTWAFRLRPHVEFHNGKSFTAADVIASINHHRNKSNGSQAKAILAVIDDIKSDNDYTVVFNLNYSYVDFPFILSDYHFSICPTYENGDIDWRSGVGTGAYQLKSLDFESSGLSITTKNRNYWKINRAFFDSIETYVINDGNARLRALANGKVDVIGQISPKSAQILERIPGVNMFQVKGNLHTTIPMHTNLSPFDNYDLRLALKYAIDRRQIVERIHRGYSTVGNDHPIGFANRYLATEDEIPQREYDPDIAKFHLKRAGMSGITLQLSTADNVSPEAVDMATLYREHAAAAGIKIQVIREPADSYWSTVWRRKPWIVSRWRGRATEDLMFSTAYKAGAAWNESNWENEKFSRLLVEARAEPDGSKRREMYVEMQRIVRDEGGSVIPSFESHLFASTDVSMSGSVGGNMDLDDHKNAERWWKVSGGREPCNISEKYCANEKICIAKTESC